MSTSNRIIRTATTLGFLGTLVLVASLWWNYSGMQEEVRRIACFQADIHSSDSNSSQLENSSCSELGSASLDPLLATMENRWMILELSHASLWLAMIGGLIFGSRYAIKVNLKREKTTRELESHLASLDSLIDALPVGVVLVGRDKVVRRINKRALDILKKNEDKVVGKLCHQSFCPSRKNRCPILDLNKNLDNSEMKVRGSDGKIIPVLKSVLPFVYQGEDVLLEALVDISEREESIARLQQGMDELQRFNRLAVDRELRMVELKAEVNSLLESTGRGARYQVTGKVEMEVER